MRQMNSLSVGLYVRKRRDTLILTRLRAPVSSRALIGTPIVIEFLTSSKQTLTANSNTIRPSSIASSSSQSAAAAAARRRSAREGRRAAARRAWPRRRRPRLSILAAAASPRTRRSCRRRKRRTRRGTRRRRFATVGWLVGHLWWFLLLHMVAHKL